MDTETIAILGGVITGLTGALGLLIRWMTSMITASQERLGVVVENNTIALATVAAVIRSCKGGRK